MKCGKLSQDIKYLGLRGIVLVDNFFTRYLVMAIKTKKYTVSVTMNNQLDRCALNIRMRTNSILIRLNLI